MRAIVFASLVFILTLEAKAILRKYKPNIIVVTGSVGKTSSKDAIYTALKDYTFVRKSEKSYNSDIGVPLTILGVPNGWRNVVRWMRNLFDGLLLVILLAPYPRWLVIEVSADRPGDISKKLRWLQPKVVITTRFPDVPSHVEYFDSPRAVAREELSPLALLKKNGIAVVNADDEHTQDIELSNGVKRLTYGFSKNADVVATRYRVLTKKGLPSGISFDVRHESERVHISLLGVIGQTHVYATLAGIAGALAAGAPFTKSGEALSGMYESAPGRLRLISGINESALIDDSYNASPVAMHEALHALKSAPLTGKRIAVLGDMLELGPFSAEEHKRLGTLLFECADVVVTVGVRMRAAAESARESGMSMDSVHSFESQEDMIVFLRSTITAGDVVLIKGSQAMRMERITKALMSSPDEATTLLPRQDAEWLARL